MNSKPEAWDNTDDFSLGLGGPLYQIYLSTRLVKHPLLLLKRRIFVICSLAWLPLLLLSVLGGTAFGGVKLPFIFDMDVHVRFLVSLALLIYAESIAHEQIKIIVKQFLSCNIIPLNHRPQFNFAIASAMRIRNSVAVEVILIVLVFTLGHWISVKYFPLGVSNWYADKINNTVQYTPAGYWYVFVSLPLFQFILLRWYFRIGIWYGFLWKVSRFPLQLNSLHPDKAGGLGFLANSVYAFAPLLLAHSVLLGGMILNRIWNAGASLADFQVEMISIILFLIILPLVPMLFFVLPMAKAKRVGTLKYDVVANRYVSEFRQKWIEAKTKNNETLLGSQDIQALADLANSFGVSIQMRVLPFDKHSIIALMFLAALPLFPLILTIIPVEKIMQQVFSIIF